MLAMADFSAGYANICQFKHCSLKGCWRPLPPEPSCLVKNLSLSHIFPTILEHG